MGIIGDIVGGAAGVAGSIFGGISASKAMKKVRNSLQQQREQNRNWYDRKYNEDETQRADAIAAVTRLQEDIRKRNRSAAGTQAVTGGTDESVAAEKAANARTQADTMAQIAAAGGRRKDAIEAQYIAKDEALQAELDNMERQKAGAVSEAIKGVAGAAGNMASIL